MAVLAITAADRFGICDAAGPHGSRGPLRNALPAEGRRALGLTGIDIRDQLFAHLCSQVSTQFRLDAPRMHRRCPDPTRFVTPIKFDRKQHIGGLRAAVGNEFLITRVFKTRILKIDIRISMSCG